MSKRRKEAIHKNTFTKRISNELDLPDDLTKNSYHIELSSNSSAIIEGCKGVLIYDENEIRLNTGRGSVTFSGSDLTIRTMSFEEAVIEGTIISIEFI